MNDMYAGQKIQRNIAVLQQCEQIAAVQCNSVQQVLNYVNTNLRSIEMECNRLKNAIRSERVVMFDAVSEFTSLFIE